ncbi:SPFH domain-containing protein [Litorivivens sp.]|uniref:SPFH domain-containing protein n=1 Tax=Litorivivens sp. TaxID=2020868 RepID=UPI00356539BB
MGTIVIILIVLLAGIIFTFVAQSSADPKTKRTFHTVSILCYVAALLTLAMASYTTVPAGHVKVASLFGKVQPVPFDEGLHFPVNPLYSWTEFDLRQKTHKERAGVPSEDKLITEMDVSVQYRTIGSMAPDILRNTGKTQDIINVHMIPKLRSILREQGKGIKQAQDFFLESVQAQLQVTLQTSLSEYLAPKGLQVETVLIRDVVLPAVIRNAITETKKREQEVLKQQAELERFATEQNQKVKQAESELQAAKLEAEKIRALADAEAYQIEVINRQLAKSPNYIHLKEVERWNGVLPKYTGNSSVPILDLRKE